MATYAIGDIQGCFSSLKKLTELIGFDPVKDRLWLVGDLVNRGPDSLSVLRYIKGLGPAAIAVLGNHDLHLLAVAGGITSLRRHDTIQDILNAPDREELLAWLRQRPLLHVGNDSVLVHAGLLPQWTVPKARELADEAERILRSDRYKTYLPLYYGKERAGPWSEDLNEEERFSVTVKALTRLRVCTPQGEMEFSFKGPPHEAPKGFLPWFQIPGRRSNDVTLVCGHWGALGLRNEHNHLALDTGCAWGRQLTAVRLEDRAPFQVPCGKKDTSS